MVDELRGLLAGALTNRLEDAGLAPPGPKAPPASKGSLPAKFITISDVPVCKDFEISKNLSELALKRHTKAYVTMFKAYLQDGSCREITSG